MSFIDKPFNSNPRVRCAGSGQAWTSINGLILEDTFDSAGDNRTWAIISGAGIRGILGFRASPDFAGDPLAGGSTKMFLNKEGGLSLLEQAGAAPDTEANGQFWVKNDTPNVPMFTGDDGVDHQLAFVP